MSWLDGEEKLRETRSVHVTFVQGHLFLFPTPALRLGMSRKRQQKQADDLTELQEDQVLCIVKGTSGSNTFECSDGLAESTFNAELPPRFRKTLWIRRGN